MGATSMVRAGVTRFLPGFRTEFYASDSLRLNNSASSYADHQLPETSFADVEFEFLDDGDNNSMAKSASSDDFQPNEMELDHEDDSERGNAASTVDQDPTFWENQHQLLQANIFRISSAESKIRNATKEAIKEIEKEEIACSCNKQMAASSCRNCLLRELSRRLQNAGYSSAVCKTKWKSSPNIPSGEHTFVDVIDNTNTKKGEVRVIIELNFRAEFEMAKASDDYNQLVRNLPEMFVGKVERLNNIIKILCMAAKRCMKVNKMHMGPWRKHKYMQTKWLGPCKRNTSTTSDLSMGYSQGMMMQRSKPKASLLTVDLLEKLPNMHRTVVQVA